MFNPTNHVAKEAMKREGYPKSEVRESEVRDANVSEEAALLFTFSYPKMSAAFSCRPRRILTTQAVPRDRRRRYEHTTQLYFGIGFLGLSLVVKSTAQVVG
jgi:hypothetical protein